MADTRRAREMVVGQIHHHHKEQQQQQQQQHRRGYSMSSARREKDEELALFQDMRKCEHTQYLLSDLEDAKLGDLFDPIAAACIERKGVGADLLNSDADKNDYDWLLTPPGTPLFPSLDLESHAYTPLQQQQGLLMNHSLAAIKTSRIASNNHAEGLVLKSLVRGSQNPNQRPGSSTPLSTQSNSTPRSTPTTTTTSGTPHSVKPSTPTKSSTSSASKFSLRVASSTPAQQSPSITSSFTGRASTAYSNRPSTPTNRPSTPTGRPSTPTLRRSSSSSTSTRAFSTVTARGNPSPTRSTASSGASRGISPVRSQYKGNSPARGISPVRSQYKGNSPARGISPVRSQYKGNSPARGRSPVPAMERGSSSSPRIHSVIIPDGLTSDIPPNLRTTSDRAPSSAHHRYAGYSEATTTQMPDMLDHTSNQPVSPNFVRSRRSTSHGQDCSSVQSGRVSSDDDSSSYEVSSQSAVSSRGLTPERGRGYAQQPQPPVGNEDWRKSHSSFQAKQSPSSRDSPHFGTTLTRKTPNAVSRNLEIHRSSSSGGFRPLMTKNSISTLYNSSSSSSSSNSTAAAAAATTRANTLPQRPLTPGSTASSEQGAASVAPDSDGDEDLLNAWGQLELSSLGGGGHADILVLDKEHKKLTSWESLQQYGQDLKLPESTIVHSDMHDEADSYKSHGFSGTREALVVEEEEEESSLHSVSSLSVRELKLRSMLDEESNSECMGATTEWLCSDLVAKKGTDLKVHEKGREQPEHKQQVLNLQVAKKGTDLKVHEKGREEPEHKLQVLNLQAKEDNIAVLPEFWCNSELDLHNELDTERGRRALSSSSSLLKDESCGSENEVVIGKEMESSGSHPEKDAGIAMDLMHVREKLILMCCSNPNLEPPDLQQCSEQNKKLSEKPQAGNIVVEQLYVPSLVVLPFQELCMSSEHESNNDVAATEEEEAETGSNTEAAANTEIKCVCNHAKHPGKHCESPGCECITGHAGASAPSAPKMELQSLTHDESVESEAVKSAILGSEAQNALDMARQKNIWYMYRNSEDYVSSLCDNTETTELEAVSSQGGGGGGFSSEMEKEVQTAAGSHHMNTSSTGIMQVLELSNHQQGVEDEASNHEQQNKDPLNLFTIGSEESLTSIQMELESQRQQEKEEDLQNGLVEQEDNSVYTTTACNDPHTKCMELLLLQLLNHVSEHVASGVCWQELTKPGSDVLGSRSVHDDSEVDILSSMLSDQELDPNLESMLGENQKLKDRRRTVQEVMAQLAMEDVLKHNDDNETSTSSEELEHEREDPGYGLLLVPLIAKLPNVEMFECSESRVTIEETEDSEVQPALSGRQDGIKSPGDHQDFKHSSPDPQGRIGSTQQTVGPDPQALVASTLQTAGPDPQALVASTLQTAGPDLQALVASALQTVGPDPQALVASALQTVGPDPQALVASTLQTAGPDPDALVASTQETAGPDPQALIFSTLQTAGPDPQALIASAQQTASPDPQALVASALQTAGPDPQVLVASTLQTAGPDPHELVASTQETAGPDPQALIFSTLQTAGPDPQSLIGSTQQTASPDPQALVVCTLQTAGPDPQALVAFTLQTVGPDPQALVASTLQTVGLDPQALVASAPQIAGPDPQALVASAPQIAGPDPQALVASAPQIAGPDPQALVASAPQIAGPDPQALVASAPQIAGPDPQALVASAPQIAGPDPQALVASAPQIVGPDPQALVASALQIVGPDPQALVASAPQIVGPDPQALVASALQIVGPDPQALVASTPQFVHANQVADVIRSGEDVEHDQANVYSDQKGLEHIRVSEAAALETKMGDACSHRDEAQNIEQGMMIASVEELHFLDILEDGGCTSLSHPGSSDASIQQSSVSGTTDDADVNMPAEDPKQVQCSKTSDLWKSPQMMMHSPVVESEEPISANLALPVMAAATERVPEFDEVMKDLTQHTEGQGTKPVVGSVPFVVNDNNNSLTLVKPVVKLHENSIREAVVEKLVVDIVHVGVKGFDDESKEVISCDAQKPGAEEGNKQSLCVEKKPYALHLTSLHSKAFEAPFGGLRGRVTARLQATLSKSESSKSSGSFLASSLDVSQSTDTISSCPSISSWEDPQYCLSSGFWEMMKSSPTNAHVSDDVLDLSFPMELQKRGTGIKQGEDEVTKSSPSCDQCALVRFGSVRASQPEDESIIKQQTPSEENCLDYYSVDNALLGGSKTTSAAGLWQIVENLKTLSDSETQKKDEIMTETDSRTISARTSNQTLASEEIVVEHGMLVPPKAVENMHALDSVAALDGKMVTFPNMVVSPVKDEIVENSESPGPNSWKHLSSFKFGRTSTIAEPERKDMLNMSLEVFTDDNLKQEVPLTGKLPGKSQTMTPGRKAMDALNGMQLSKVNMVVTDGKSSMQEVQSGDSSQPVQLTQWSTHGIRRMAEELNGQSRFSNSTVHPGSVSEYFEWERSSLDEVSCSSSSGRKHTVAASGMVSQNISLAEVTDRILFCSSIVHDLVYEAAELASKKETKSSRTTTSSSADLKGFSPNAGHLSGQEKYCEHDNNQNGHAGDESTNVGNEKYHEHDNMHGHAQEGGNSLGSGTTMTARQSLTNPPNEGFEMPPGSRTSMSSPQVQVMCIRSKEAESMVKEDVIMHPTETVRLNREVNFNAKKTNDKCRCVIL